MCLPPRRFEPFYATCPWIAEFWNTLSNLPFLVIAGLRLLELRMAGTSSDRTPEATLSYYPYTSPSLLPHPLDPHVELLYLWMLAMGLASAVHHATTTKWTIVVDWVPIAGCLAFLWHHGLLWRCVGRPPLCTALEFSLSPAVVFQLFVALGVFLTDHLTALIPAPWGHVMWHLLIAGVMDAAFQELRGGREARDFCGIKSTRNAFYCHSTHHQGPRRDRVRLLRVLERRVVLKQILPRRRGIHESVLVPHALVPLHQGVNRRLNGLPGVPRHHSAGQQDSCKGISEDLVPLHDARP